MMVEIDKYDVVRLQMWYQIVFGEGKNIDEDDELNNKLHKLKSELWL